MSKSPPLSGQSSEDEGVSIRVYRSDLKAVHQSGLRLSNFLGSRKAFRLRKRVKVESVPSKISETVLYADPHASDTHGVAIVPTEHIMISLEQNGRNVVRRDDDFEIKFIGFSATPKDLSAWNGNEILMYSLSSDPKAAGMAVGQFEAQSAHVPTGIIPSCNDMVYIHYDPVVDSHNEGTQPDMYTPIPASKSIYKRYEADFGENLPFEINVRFTMMEIDKVTDLQARSVAGIDRVGMFVSNAAVAVPYAELIPKAFALASAVGRNGLKKYSRPDHVLSRDIQFLLGPPKHDRCGDDESTVESGPEVCSYPAHGDYLRYGYYFFLSKTCEAKLYAQTGSSAQRVPLFMKRKDVVSEYERSYFPLTEISYIVMKVSRGCSARWETVNFERQKREHRTRLENILNMSSVMEMLSTVEEQKRKGGRR